MNNRAIAPFGIVLAAALLSAACAREPKPEPAPRPFRPGR